MSGTELNENASAKVQLAFAAKVICICGSLVWGYSVIWNKLNELDNSIHRMEFEVEKNSDFRHRWPMGEWGSGELPADSKQNMNIEHIKVRLDKLDEHVDKLRHGKDSQ
jgi:hypothetical protein